MKEYFVVANSFAAPFVSDESTRHASGEDPVSTLEQFARVYKHPYGLFAANLYDNADAYHKGRPALAQWLSNAAREQQLSGRTKRKIADPKSGRAELVK